MIAIKSDAYKLGYVPSKCNFTSLSYSVLPGLVFDPHSTLYALDPPYSGIDFSP